MKITIQIDQLSIDLSADALEAVVSGLPDTEEYRDVYAALAAHPASAVRLQVACKDQLTEESVALLAKDVSPEVRRNVLRTAAGRAHLDETTLRTLAASDIECAEVIAGNIGEYQLESEKLAEALAEHSDPRVRRAAASCSSMPKRLLKKLAKDPDANVRLHAAYALA